MTFKSFRFAEVMLSSEGKEQMKGTQMWDKGKKRAVKRKEEEPTRRETESEEEEVAGGLLVWRKRWWWRGGTGERRRMMRNDTWGDINRRWLQCRRQISFFLGDWLRSDSGVNIYSWQLGMSPERERKKEKIEMRAADVQLTISLLFLWSLKMDSRVSSCSLLFASFYSFKEKKSCKSVSSNLLRMSGYNHHPLRIPNKTACEIIITESPTKINGLTVC